MGGLSSNCSNDVRVFDVLDQKWTNIKAEISKDDYVSPRFAHSLVLFKDKLIIYGGGANYLEKSKCRVTLSDIRYFDLSKCTGC